MRLPFFSFEKRKEKKNRYVLYYEKSVSSIAKGGELFTVGEFAQRRERRVGVEKTHRVGIDLRDLFPFQSFPFLLLVVCLSLSSFRCKRSLVPFCGGGAPPLQKSLLLHTTSFPTHGKSFFSLIHTLVWRMAEGKGCEEEEGCEKKLADAEGEKNFGGFFHSLPFFFEWVIFMWELFSLTYCTAVE